MMQGFVNQSCEAMLSVVVKNDAKTQLIDAVIDTGYSGFLTLPSSVIAAVDLTWKGRDVATLGDGTSCIFEVYIAIVIWDGQVSHDRHQRIRNGSFDWNAVIEGLRFADSDH